MYLLWGALPHDKALLVDGSVLTQCADDLAHSPAHGSILHRLDGERFAVGPSAAVQTKNLWAAMGTRYENS